MKNYEILKKKIEKERERIDKIKEFFEENSFKNSQMWKWVQEFGEFEQALKEHKSWNDHSTIMGLAGEIADELITRAQTDIKEEEFFKKIKLEEWDEMYFEFIELNTTLILNAIDSKLKRTEERIETRFYNQYN